MLDMDTTTKVLEQVSCQACGKSMSAKNLKYSHQKYCTERNKEEKPEEIPIPQIEIKNAPQIKNLKTLPVKSGKAKAKAIPEQIEEKEPASLAPEAPYKSQCTKHETPEEFWRNTMKALKDKKMAHYKYLCSNAFNISY